MRREDYERMEPKKAVPSGPVEEDGYEVAFRCTAALHEDGVDVGVLVIMDICGTPNHAMIPLRSKHDADEMIRCLIAARNKIWPTP